MPRTSRVELNRQALDQTMVIVADGLFAVAETIVEAARPPDAKPFGQGLVTQGGALAYVGSKKVAGWSQKGTQPKKPRSVRVSSRGGIMAIAGFGFPGRFQERGTIHHAAQPFLWPTAVRVAQRAEAIMRSIVAPTLRGFGIRRIGFR